MGRAKQMKPDAVIDPESGSVLDRRQDQARYEEAMSKESFGFHWTKVGAFWERFYNKRIIEQAMDKEVEFRSIYKVTVQSVRPQALQSTKKSNTQQERITVSYRKGQTGTVHRQYDYVVVANGRNNAAWYPMAHGDFLKRREGYAS